ncbi:XrtA system polysaccharide deacetylase [Alishewanella jeotgali]|uniref:Polysaccharide deacetylase n=1 Tax=Alishewanella jeotgali KCTC 22429 TaxID=1129374 RepID=H3ZB73_9ALTE|nr:XrtA system polysaccharide deacetylase [Alishewanella jeotgali]EHR42187.1 polysaccharide deacetylase [Alishewanella jeotgali KCTC 22429]
MNTLPIKPTSALTVDVEDYFHVAAFEKTILPADWAKMPVRVEANTYKLLELFARYDAKATFFLLGWVAKRYPELVRDLVKAGHEVASHGFNHIKATQQSRAEFAKDITDTKNLLEDITGTAVYGYRAPSFSIDKTNEWAFTELKAAGYLYSSSTYPVKHDLYGTPDWPQQPYLRPEGIWECPMPVLNKVGRQWPIAGGGYFRLLPYWLSKKCIEQYLQQSASPYMFYFHPWEIDPEQPRIDAAPYKSRFRHYTNLNRMQGKLSRLLQDFQWRSVQDVYRPYFM